jgi:hypothetical protein
MWATPDFRSMSPTLRDVRDPRRIPVPSRILERRRSRSANGPDFFVRTNRISATSASVRVVGSLGVAGDDRIIRDGFALVHPDSTQKAKNDRSADLVLLADMGERGSPSGVWSTASEVRDRAGEPGAI